MARFTFLHSQIVNISEIEYIDDKKKDAVIHFRSGKTLTLNSENECFERLLKDINMWDELDRKE